MVKSETPIFVEFWKKRAEFQMRLVNYAQESAKVQVNFKKVVSGKVFSPDADDFEFTGDRLELDLDVYSLITYKQLSNRG